MKSLMVFVLSLVVLTSCQSQPPYTDNGNPGQIKAIIFYDDNRNRVLDSNEIGAETELGISQDISCPPSRDEAITPILADINGEVLFQDLKPGKYCIHPMGNFGMTTKQNQEVYVSSDQTTTVLFGIVKD
ncbi:MAG: hypothetical protein R6W69_07015 [Anaerolineales bacterium]